MKDLAECLNEDLQDSQYNPENIRRNLDAHRDITLEVLYQATADGRIAVDTPEGKESWKAVMEFYQQRGLEEELIAVKEKFYELTATSSEKSCRYWLTRLVSGPGTILALGLLGPDEMVPAIRSYCHDRYVRKFLLQIA